MRALFRRAVVLIVVSAFLMPLAGSGPADASLRRAAGNIAIAAASPPQRIRVTEPLRVKPSPVPASAMRPTVVPGTRAHGIHVAGPPMLRPNEIDRILAAARRRTLQLKPAAPFTPAGRSVPQPAVGTQPATRRAMSLPSDPTASGTGINPWWRYQEENIPGGGRQMVNVGTGNVLIQDDDMSVPHKGIALAFRRTYNSQAAAANLATQWGNFQSLYGNGWTNTFDARFVSQSTTLKSVYDIDGARYDYSRDPSTGLLTSITPGQHATMVFDGNCGWLWTKKSGTTYYFYTSNPNNSVSCPAISTIGGYSGRLYQIIGRNRNTYITFAYSWDNGNASMTGKINQITASAESGMAATLAFGDVNGRRLLQQLTYPDGQTYVAYGYDSLGNLTTVSRPPNNSSGTRPTQGFGYQTMGSDSVIYDVQSPRSYAACATSAGCYGDGGGNIFGFAGTSAATSTLTTIQHVYLVNPIIPDGTNSGALQGTGYSTIAYPYNIAYYTTGVTTPTFRDTDGHMTNWVVDGMGRPTQVQVATGGGNYLVSNETWDTANNLVTVIDPRGARTDAAYDAAGNAVAIAQPSQSANGPRPTVLIDYDSFNNVVAYCDPAENDPSFDWTGQYGGGSDSYCSSGPSTHARFSYTYPSYQPYGELTGVTSPSGYTRNISYDATSQAGADYGLPTRVSGTAMPQFDSSSRQPNASATYDANGNIICARADSASGATSVLTYDSLNRLASSADPDDASLNATVCGKTAGLAGSTIVTTWSYYPDGSVATVKTPSEAAADHCNGYACTSNGTTYTYDLDGNPTAESAFGALRPRIQRWYDGADRLVESDEPADPNTSGDFPLLMRYIYDLSQGGSPRTLTGPAVTAFGNLYEVQKNTPTGWTDFNYAAFDAADRVTTAYAFAPCPSVSGGSGPIYCTKNAFATRYDWDSSVLTTTTAPGKLVAAVDGLGQSKVYSYNGAAQIVAVSYGGDGGVTPNLAYTYDIAGRIASATNAPSNTISYSYSPDGELSTVQNLSLSATTSYSYYSDGAIAGVSSSASSWVNVPNLYRYSYRNDGRLASESFGASANQLLSYTYTLGGRWTGMTDFSASPSLTLQYDGHGQLSAYTTPAGTYGSIVHDPDGRVYQFTAFNGETVTSQYDIRGNLIGRTFVPQTQFNSANGDYPAFQYRNVQGVLVQNSGDEYDGRTGAPLILTGQQTPFTMSYDAIGRMTSTTSHGTAVRRREPPHRRRHSDCCDCGRSKLCDWWAVDRSFGPIDRDQLFV